MADQKTPVKNAPCVLIIRDGWGRNPNPDEHEHNAIAQAKTPVADRIERDWPTTLIGTSGEAVGLPEETMGNSEVGHQNLGAGRVVDQTAVRISKAIREGRFFENPALREAISGAVRHGRAVHLMGIASDAGVHGKLEHLYACIELCRDLNADKVFLHLFTDGRDTGPFTGKRFIQEVEAKCDEIGVGAIASIIGRYYAMDRDNRWERVARAYACLTGSKADERETRSAATAEEAVERYYDEPDAENLRGDEFIAPTMIGEGDAALASRVAAHDAVVFYNYRGDRPRELCRAFVLPEFEGRVPASPDSEKKGFDRGGKLPLRFVTMAAYAEDLEKHVKVAFPRPPKMVAIAGEVISDLGLTQFRCAETEKFPHVTFFFNDYRDDPFDGERREIIQSPRVDTYDKQPEMSAAGVRDAVMQRLSADDPEPFIVVNFANPDMVGHTGNFDAVVAAVETVDACVGELVDRVLELGGSAIVTADHGNAEQMWDPETEAAQTAHTIFDVPLSVVGEPFKGRSLREGGKLADVVPTMFEMMGLDQPPEMTGQSLLQ